MTDSTERPFEDRSDIAADGGHLHDDGVATAHAEPVHPAEGDSFRRRSDRRGLLLPLASVAVVAALIGGGIGAGVAIAVNPRTTVAAASSSGSGITINNPSTATAVSAVAAKASPSVVTISVSASWRK